MGRGRRAKLVGVEARAVAGAGGVAVGRLVDALLADGDAHGERRHAEEGGRPRGGRLDRRHPHDARAEAEQARAVLDAGQDIVVDGGLTTYMSPFAREDAREKMQIRWRELEDWIEEHKSN